jgi:L-fuconolactonase
VKAAINTTVIDAHQHVWNRTAARYDWLGPDIAAIDRDFDLDDALPSMRRAGVDATILVQAADNAEDTANMIAVADRHPQVVGIVGWVPLDDPDAAARQLDELRRDPRLVGIRNLIHDRPDPDWILRPDVDAGLGVLEAAGVAFDYVTSSPAALAHVPVISERHPELRIVIDHLGKPPIGVGDDARRQWARILANAARNPRVSAKVSGLYRAHGAMYDWSPELLRPFVDHAVEAFGVDRLMWGSDWPVSELGGGYDRVWDALASIFADLAPLERAAVLGGTAASVYRLDPGLLARAGKETP